MPRPCQRVRLESGIKLDINRLARGGFIRPGATSDPVGIRWTIVYTDEELRFVREQDAPGISSYREKLGSLLEGHESCALPHEEIISKLDRVGERFRVLLIKTNMRIPYTSVFCELGCKYWDGPAERRLRAAMRSRNGHGQVSKRRARH